MVGGNKSAGVDRQGEIAAGLTISPITAQECFEGFVQFVSSSKEMRDMTEMLATNMPRGGYAWLAFSPDLMTTIRSVLHGLMAAGVHLEVKRELVVEIIERDLVAAFKAAIRRSDALGKTFPALLVAPVEFISSVSFAAGGEESAAAVIENSTECRPPVVCLGSDSVSLVDWGAVSGGMDPASAERERRRQRRKQIRPSSN